MPAPSETHDYTVFGLKVRSELKLPELFAADECAVSDIAIEKGPVPSPEKSEFGLNAVDGELVLAVPDIARFKIVDGRRIIVDPCPGAPERNVRIFLLGSAFGALLHQRGLLPLHANAVEIGGKAVAFMGASGFGKSTLAAWFHKHGHRVIADDVCVIGFDAHGFPYAAPGLPRLRLWAEALELMGGDTEHYDRSFVGEAPSIEKFDVPIDAAGAARSSVGLGVLYLLDKGNEFSIDELRGMEAAEAVIANTYRGAYLSAVSGHENHWQSAVKLVRGTPAYRVSRQWDLAKLDEQCQRLREHALMAIRSGSNGSA